jgi:uncharacterized repeat protein (TIGR03803 family)
MKTPFRRALLAMAMAIVSFYLGEPLFAATPSYSTLYSFTPYPDGYRPVSDLRLVGNSFYGTTRVGGDYGTVYGLNTDGSGYRTLHTFELDAIGCNPETGLVSDGLKIYGTTLGTIVNGVIVGGSAFSMNTDGSGFQVLHYWTGASTDGRNGGNMLLLGSTLYGGTGGGGPFNSGVLYRMTTDGTGYQILHIFGSILGDGTGPGELINSGSTLYGLCNSGGGGGLKGTVFKINTDGTGYQILHTFTGADGSKPDGRRLSLVNSKLYGVTYEGGSNNVGVLFSMNTDGGGYQVLHSFLGGSDGKYPSSYLTQIGSKFYGETFQGGSANEGTIYSLNLDGTGYSVFRSFTGIGDDGAAAIGGMIASDSTLYGVTEDGGAGGWGSVFALTVPEPSTLVLSAGAAALLSLTLLRRRPRAI